MKIDYNYYEQDKKASFNYGSRKRLDMISQGAYDGRFRNKVVTDKKKQHSKTAARKWKIDRY